MDFNSALDIIIKDLGEAAKIIGDLKNYSGVPAFQVELAKAKCRSAAEIIALLKEMPVAPEVVIDHHGIKDPAEIVEAKNISTHDEPEKRASGNKADTFEIIDDAGNEPSPIEEAPVPPKKIGRASCRERV